MAKESRVYLDHLISRESLRYQPPAEEMGRQQGNGTSLQLNVLLSQRDSYPHNYYRKPDFQRATWAWTPQDCLSLLESVVNYQVVPSIIMWAGESYVYVLDGAHRLSVVMAWFRDDWGDKLSTDEYEDDQQRRQIKAIAQEVRNLVNATIGSFGSYKKANEEYDRIADEEGAPKLKMSKVDFERSMFYRNLFFGTIGFPILSVHGDYDTAEKSFLKINKSGRQLSNWETKLIENRNSSLARAVMSISNVSSAEHYWPKQLGGIEGEEVLRQEVESILENVRHLNETILQPAYTPPVRSLKQPLLVAKRQEKPKYLAELFTVLEGRAGSEADTEMLIEAGHDADPVEIIRSGNKLLNDVSEAFSHLVGASPKSLGLVPVFYFYSSAGRPVRSLLYGFIYWMLNGTEDVVRSRKTTFCAYRSKFEEVLRQRKEDLVKGTTRGTGSGSDVTFKTAHYFDQLLNLLSKQNGDIESKGFEKQYVEMVRTLFNSRIRPSSSRASDSRIFTPIQKQQDILRAIFEHYVPCGICGGMLDPSEPVQHDHIVERRKGGEGSLENLRITHPFCNNMRPEIEAIRSGSIESKIPQLIFGASGTFSIQLSLFDDPDFV